jgi:CDP-4-dehydro-6-deoxyglucose reductase
VLQEKSTRALYFIAFDLGFAPIKSLIEHAMSLEAAEAIHLFWMGSKESSIYLPNIPRSWADALDNFHYTQTVVDFDLANMNGKREESLKQILKAILQEHPNVKEGDIYIAGSSVANHIAEQFFLDLGLPKTRVFSSS